MINNRNFILSFDSSPKKKKKTVPKIRKMTSQKYGQLDKIVNRNMGNYETFGPSGSTQKSVTRTQKKKYISKKS